MMFVCSSSRRADPLILLMVSSSGVKDLFQCNGSVLAVSLSPHMLVQYLKSFDCQKEVKENGLVFFWLVFNVELYILYGNTDSSAAVSRTGSGNQTGQKIQQLMYSNSHCGSPPFTICLSFVSVVVDKVIRNLHLHYIYTCFQSWSDLGV